MKGGHHIQLLSKSLDTQSHFSKKCHIISFEIVMCAMQYPNLTPATKFKRWVMWRNLTKIVGMPRGGASITKIAAETKRPRGSVGTIFRRFGGRANSKLRNVVDDHLWQHQEMKEPQASPNDLAKMWGAIVKNTVSERTTRRRLNSLGYDDEWHWRTAIDASKPSPKTIPELKEVV